jgi:hypothetical protein
MYVPAKIRTGIIPRPGPLSGGTWYLRDDFTAGTMAGGGDEDWTKNRNCCVFPNTDAGQLRILTQYGGMFALNPTKDVLYTCADITGKGWVVGDSLEDNGGGAGDWTAKLGLIIDATHVVIQLLAAKVYADAYAADGIKNNTHASTAATTAKVDPNSKSCLLFRANASTQTVKGWSGGAVTTPFAGGAFLTKDFAPGLWSQVRLFVGADDPWFAFGWYYDDNNAHRVLALTYHGQHTASVHALDLVAGVGAGGLSLHLDFGYAQPASASNVCDVVPMDVGLYYRRLIDATHAEVELWVKFPWLTGCHPCSDDWFCMWRGTIDPTAIPGGIVGLRYEHYNAGVTTTERVMLLEWGLGVFDPARRSRHRFLLRPDGLSSTPVSACAWVRDPSLAAGGRLLAAVRDGALGEAGTDAHIHLLAATDEALAVWDEITVDAGALFPTGGGYSYRSVEMGASGRTVLAVADKVGGANINLVGRTSQDGGLTWGAEFVINNDAHDFVACGRSVIRHSSGRWIVPYHYDPRYLMLSYTDDAVPDATGWHNLALTDGSQLLNEASVVERADGTLLLMTRASGDDYAWFSTCASPAGAGIATWTTPVQFDGKSGRDYLPNGVAPFMLLRGQLGRLHMIGGGATAGWDYANGAGCLGRFAIGHRYSDDGGATWQWAMNSPIFSLRELCAQYPWVARDGRRGFITWTTGNGCCAIVDPGMFAEDGYVPG